MNMDPVTPLMVTIVVLLSAAQPVSTADTRTLHFQTCSANGFYNASFLASLLVRNSMDYANRCLMQDGCQSFFLSLNRTTGHSGLQMCHMSLKVYHCFELNTSSRGYTYYYPYNYEWPLTNSSEDSTVSPEETTFSPEDSTVSPEDTTVSHEDSTVNPEDTTVSPEDSTTNPEDTTVSPEDSTTNPEDTTVSPEDSTTNKPISIAPGSTVVDDPDSMAWSYLYGADENGTPYEGTVGDLQAAVLHGKSFRVLVDGYDKTRLIHLDSVHASVDGSKITGTAYAYDSFTLGESFFVKIEVNTDGEVLEVSFIGGAMSQSITTSYMSWFVSNKKRDCQQRNPPPLKSPSQIVSVDDHGTTVYRAFGVFNTGIGAGTQALGLYVSPVASSDLSLSLRKINLSTQAELEATVNLLTGHGETLTQSDTWRKSTVFTNTCFDLVLDTTGGFSMEPIMSAVQKGSDLVVSFFCDNPTGQVTHVLEVEEALITDPETHFPVITAFVKNFVSYKTNRLVWQEIAIDTVGAVHSNGSELPCNGVRFYAKNGRREMINITATRFGGLTAEDELQLEYYLGQGHLPRLKLETMSGDLAFFNIEVADYSIGESLILRSYRYVSSHQNRALFHVYTFDVRNCQYSYEINNIEKKIRSPEPAGTPAASMTLFFEKIYQTD